MNSEEYADKTTMALNNHRKELDQMSEQITTAAKEKKPIPNLKDVFKEITEAARECSDTVDFYDEEDLMPQSVRQALVSTLDEIKDCAAALVLHEALTKS